MEGLRWLEKVGDVLVELFHIIALFVIGGTIIWSAVYEYLEMIEKGYADLKDILLLFIYLELGAMTGIFFRTHKLPVIFLLFIAMTALTRYLAIDLKELTGEAIVLVAVAILILSAAGFLLRFSDYRFTRHGADSRADGDTSTG